MNIFETVKPLKIHENVQQNLYPDCNQITLVAQFGSNQVSVKSSHIDKEQIITLPKERAVFAFALLSAGFLAPLNSLHSIHIGWAECWVSRVKHMLCKLADLAEFPHLQKGLPSLTRQCSKLSKLVFFSYLSSFKLLPLFARLLFISQTAAFFLLCSCLLHFF